jgi:transketolase
MLSKQKAEELKAFATQIRIETIRAIESVGVGHIGGAMSIVEALAVLYGGVMKIDPNNPGWEERDWFVLSKGHSGPALYAALALKGYFPKEELLTLNKPRTRLPSHCDRRKTPGVDMSTGSLGQGMSTALGVAQGLLMDGKPNRVYLIIGDGECNEGQIWEGAMFAAQRKLHNVIAFVDWNKKQLDGYLKDICDIGDIRQKFEDFGWFAQSVDGHDVTEIHAAIEKAQAQTEKPSLIALNTVKGKSCSFSEGVFYNHSMPVSAEQAQCAIDALCGKQ